MNKKLLLALFLLNCAWAFPMGSNGMPSGVQDMASNLASNPNVSGIVGEIANRTKPMVQNMTSEQARSMIQNASGSAANVVYSMFSNGSLSVKSGGGYVKISKQGVEIYNVSNVAAANITRSNISVELNYGNKTKSVNIIRNNSRVIMETSGARVDLTSVSSVEIRDSKLIVNNKTLSLGPDDALGKMGISASVPVNLKVTKDDVLYVANQVQTRHLFGIIPVPVNITAYVSALTGQAGSQTPWWYLPFLFSQR